MTIAADMNTKRVPVVLTGQALQSLRDSGYSLAAALGEVVDNSLEANANNILVHLEEGQSGAGKRHIHRIVIADDGDGMDLDTLHHYLQLGFSTRYMRKDTVGKYGVGAKLAALNFGKRIEVWSRTRGDEPWQYVSFDLEDAIEAEQRGEVVGIDAPSQQPIPPELAELIPSGSGTIVVWGKVDKLEEGRRAPDATALRVGVEKELSRMFRYYLSGGRRIAVNGRDLLAHDPLFLMEGSWADKTLHEYYSRRKGDDGAENGEVPMHFPAKIFLDHEPIPIGGSQAYLTVTLYPAEVTRVRGSGGDELAKKMRVPENEGAISFVRLDREINYTSVPRIFPRGVEEPDRFIGIEVWFNPELDEYFGVRNVKRGVEPHDELREQIRKLLRKYVKEAREELETRWGKVSRESREHRGEHSAVLEAVKEADRTMPKSRVKETRDEVEQQRVLRDLARDVVGNNENAQREYLERIRNLPFVVESVDFAGSQFVDVQHLGHQVIIRINTRHRFYREMWEPLKSISERDPGAVTPEEAVRASRRGVEALTLLLIAYGKAESMHETPRDQYGDLRNFWGMFVDSLLGRVKDVI